MQNQKKSPKTLSSNELSEFLNWFTIQTGQRSRDQMWFRNYCMALLMADAGLRVGEVVRLLQTDLTVNCLPVKQLQVTANISKSKSDRMIPLSVRLQQAINVLRNKIWIYSESNRLIFAFYTKDPMYPITVRQVERIFKSAGRRSIGREVNPHMLRHTFGSKMMRVTNAAIVQELMGHKHLSSTQVYMHPNGDDLQDAIDSLNE